MTNLKHLSDYQLHHRLQDLVSQERKLLTEILHHLKEVENRRLYAQMGFSSMFDYATAGLGYSESAAYRRIAAARLMQAIPNVEDDLNSGNLSLSTASLAQSVFNNEKKENKNEISPTEKRKVLNSLAGKSKKQAEQILAEKFPASAPKKEKTQPINAEQTSIQFLADCALIEKIKRIGDLKPATAGSYFKLFHLMADVVLAKIDPMMQKPRGAAKGSGLQKNQNKDYSQQNRTPKPTTSAPSSSVVAKDLPNDSQKSKPERSPAEVEKQKLNVSRDGRVLPSSRYTRVAAKQTVWTREPNQCAWVDRRTGRRCTSTFGLELDHRIPWACGGLNEPDNLQLLCRAHNLLKAERQFGREKMRVFYSLNKSG